MLAYTGYECDNRVRRYAEALVKRGDEVDVFALATGNFPIGVDRIAGVTLYRIQHRDFVEKYKLSYLWRLLRFLLVSSFLIARRHYRLRYDLIHIHNVPDFLVFAAWYPKLTGVKLILDIHDIVPEFFSSKFGIRESSLYVKLLKNLERASAKFVDHVIVSNDLWRDKLISRSVAAEKCSVFINHVDPSIFYRRTRTRSDDAVIILFPGTFQAHQGLDIAIQAFSYLQERLPQAELHLYGGGGVEAELRKQAERLGLNTRIKFLAGVSLDEVADVMANADVGIVPKRANSFGNEAYSTKIMEFMSQGLPVVASRTKIDTFYFDESVVHFFTDGDARAMAAAVLEVLENEALRGELIRNGYDYVEQHNWERRKREYLDLVDSLVTNDSTPRMGASSNITVASAAK